MDNECQDKERVNKSSIWEDKKTNDKKQIDEDMLNSALDKMKKETEEKYERKMKNMMEEVAKEHKLSLGKDEWRLLFKWII